MIEWVCLKFSNSGTMRRVSMYYGWEWSSTDHFLIESGMVSHSGGQAVRSASPAPLLDPLFHNSKYLAMFPLVDITVKDEFHRNRNHLIM